MTPDFEYVQAKDGFASIMPNTPDAVATYNTMFGEGAYRFMPHELTAFKSQARKAGYTVRKAKSLVMTDDWSALLADLEAK